MDLTTGSGTSTRGVHTAEPPRPCSSLCFTDPERIPRLFTPTKGPSRRSPTHCQPHAAAHGAGPEPAIRWPTTLTGPQDIRASATRPWQHRTVAQLTSPSIGRWGATRCSRCLQKNWLRLTHQPNWSRPVRPERLTASREPPRSTGTERTPHTPSLHSVVPITSTRVTRRGEPRGLTQAPVVAWLPGQTGEQVPQTGAGGAATNGPRR